MPKLKSAWMYVDGKKTYIIMTITIVYAVVVIGFVQKDWKMASELILGALGLGSVRHAVSKK